MIGGRKIRPDIHSPSPWPSPIERERGLDREGTDPAGRLLQEAKVFAMTRLRWFIIFIRHPSLIPALARNDEINILFRKNDQSQLWIT